MATNNQINSIKDAQAQVATFKTNLAASRKGIAVQGAELSTAKHKSGCDTIASALGLALRLLDNGEVYNLVLTQAGVAREKEGANRFGPIVRLLFRKAQAGGGTIADDSAWKYGNVLRYCADQGWGEANASANLMSLKAEVDGRKVGKLVAAELLDRQKYKEEDAAAKATESYAFEHWRQGEGLAIISNDAAEVDVGDCPPGRIASFAATWEPAKGGWVIRSLLDDKDAPARNKLRKRVIADFDQHNRSLFAGLATHNREMDEADAKLDKLKATTAVIGDKVGKKLLGDTPVEQAA